MAWSPPKTCKFPNCGKTRDTGSTYCDKHKKSGRPAPTPTTTRGTASQRGYDIQWKAFRSLVLSKIENIICNRCQVRLATLLHHILPVRHYPEHRLSEANVLPLCRFCHTLSEKEIKEQKGFAFDLMKSAITKLNEEMKDSDSETSIVFDF